MGHRGPRPGPPGCLERRPRRQGRGYRRVEDVEEGPVGVVAQPPGSDPGAAGQAGLAGQDASEGASGVGAEGRPADGVHPGPAGVQQAAKDALDKWLSWARRCRIPAFVDLQRRVTIHVPAIHISIDHDLSNGLVESVNTKLRLLTRMAFGYRDPWALIGLGMLALGGLCPPLPGRNITVLTR